MFTEYNREFDKKLDSVEKAYEALKQQLTELHSQYHSLNESVVDTADLSGVSHFIEDLDGFFVDEIGTQRKIQDDLPGKYNTYSYQELANENRLTDRCMGLKTGRQ